MLINHTRGHALENNGLKYEEDLQKVRDLTDLDDIVDEANERLKAALKEETDNQKAKEEPKEEEKPE